MGYLLQNISKAIVFQQDIKSIQKLRTDEESEPIINLGLDMFRYAEEIYQTDFPRIAKMIDEGKPDEEIDTAIEELDNSKGVILDEKYAALMEQLLPYADKHGVKYKTFNSPF
ncbi:hypothetical protein [Sphingobacterium wenxiniae]|uniref:Uncharacterized protein n=1 Tax=Sphingobacterium wenxiniae TaxID=683125 RepID=A0A1I6P3Q0_9SPHI|nr:hypothetical protein [Sphingobacterium wenxiniae]SFS34834.1 hypothetical protein SAMN05660206_101267 [Sphingobacterium wenxiniae]